MNRGQSGIKTTAQTGTVCAVLLGFYGRDEATQEWTRVQSRHDDNHEGGKAFEDNLSVGALAVYCGGGVCGGDSIFFPGDAFGA